MQPLVNGALSRERTFGGISLVDPTTLERPDGRVCLKKLDSNLQRLCPSVTMRASPESHFHEYGHRLVVLLFGDS